ncbi:hypothetical protein BDV18DRAFT_145426 [Aspergillus unguis]
MVKIAIAGGTSGVARELIDALIATQRHELLILSRQDIPAENPEDTTVTRVKTDYASTTDLARILREANIHTLLSFIIDATEDGDSPVQKRLIDAAVQAGVKRFAPSEWGSSSLEFMPWYAYKASIRTYLSELNASKKVLEYTLFQPGLFTDYLSWPYKPTKYSSPLETPIDYYNKRAIIVAGSDDARITLTTVKDFCAVVVRALEYEEGEWPVVGGINGETMTIGNVISIGEKIRGSKFKIEAVSKESFLDDSWETSWVPKNEHPSVPRELVEQFARPATKGICLGFGEGEWAVSDEWNALIGEYEFTKAEEFLKAFWEGRD